MGITLVIGLWIGAAGVAVDGGVSLTTLAAATNRPAECAILVPRSGARKPSVWRLARLPTLGAYCDELARADALMGSDPRGALAAATKADAALPDRASTSIAIGRAKLALGEIPGALEAFERALELDKRSLDEPKAMNDYARALVLAGRAADAAELYRELVPRAELLPDAARPLVYLQAAHALMAHAGLAPAAPVARDHAPREGAGAAPPARSASTDLADAAAYLAEARDATTMRGDVLLSLALVFDRAGDPEKSAAALSEAQRVGAAVTDGGKPYVAALGDGHALAALALEAAARPAAEEWTKFLDATPPPAWATAAKAHLAGGSGARRTTKKPSAEPTRPSAEPKKKRSK